MAHLPSVNLATIALEIGAAPAVSVRGDASVRVHDVQQDSRRVALGDLYVARLGESADARSRLDRFVDEAIARGAAAVMRASSEGARVLPLPTLEVPSDRLRAAIGLAASAVHGHPSFALEVLAVTGTNGKTTTSWLLAGALDRLAGKDDCAVVGTVGARLGARARPTSHTTPDGDELARLLSWARDEGAKHVAIEASSHALAQDRLVGTRLRAAAFTNLTQDHLDYHHTMEEYFAAKRRLFEDLHPGASVVCIDDAYGARLAASVRTPRVTVSSVRGTAADVRVHSSRLDASGIEAELLTPAGAVTLRSRMIGAHNLSNLCVALGMLIALNFPVEPAAAALGEAAAVRGRLELASDPEQDDVVVLVDYAHTPDALTRVLAALRPLCAARLICVFGCGGDRDPTKRAPMGRAAIEGADVAVVTSDNPRTEDAASIIAAVVEGTEGAPRLDRSAMGDAAIADATAGVVIEPDRAQAIALAIRAARKGDVVLLAGKGHEDYQIVGSDRRHFDDLEEARGALSKRRASLQETRPAAGRGR